MPPVPQTLNIVLKIDQKSVGREKWHISSFYHQTFSSETKRSSQNQLYRSLNISALLKQIVKTFFFFLNFSFNLSSRYTTRHVFSSKLLFVLWFQLSYILHRSSTETATSVQNDFWDVKPTRLRLRLETCFVEILLLMTKKRTRIWRCH